jgi:2-polyprenyl-3-methyl-5-hydroxy-6-metoxy-1,4-benzoquinol methylase
MSERKGIWSPLAVPWVYDGLHHVIGARRWLRRFARDVVKAGKGTRVLDIGCGTGALLGYLPGAIYVGLDRSEACIERAKRTYGERGTFICDDVGNLSDYSLPQVDVAVAIGLLHHIDDIQALDLLRDTKATLRPGGRLITVDPCFHSAQSVIQRFVVGHDRGKNVRNFVEYQELCARVFGTLSANWEASHFPFPHSMCILQAEA